MSDSFATQPQDDARFTRYQRRRLICMMRRRSRRAGYPIPKCLEAAWVDELEAATRRFEVARDLASSLLVRRSRAEVRRVDRILASGRAAQAV